jgi:hypothetical protein
VQYKLSVYHTANLGENAQARPLKSGINKNIYVDVPMKILIRNFRNLPVPFDVEHPLVFLNYQERYHTHTDCTGTTNTTARGSFIRTTDEQALLLPPGDPFSTRHVVPVVFQRQSDIDSFILRVCLGMVKVGTPTGTCTLFDETENVIERDMLVTLDVKQSIQSYAFS